MVSLFCRHNRFTADCPICSRGTVLDSSGDASGAAPGGTAAKRGPASPRSSAGRPRKGRGSGAAVVQGPSAAAGPYERDGAVYEVRLEKVPGGLRLAEWSAGALRAHAPVLAVADVRDLLERATQAGALKPAEGESLGTAVSTPSDEPAGEGAATHGTSPGRSGELRDELRVERLDGDRLRVARWVLRPGTGWDMLDAPTMLPASRYAEALAGAARVGLLD